MSIRSTPAPAALACLLGLGIALGGCGGDSGESTALPVYRVMLPQLDVQGEAARSSVAFAINECDAVVGTVVTDQGRHAYHWKGGRATSLSALIAGAVEGIAYNLNHEGIVIGSARIGERRQAFKWTRGKATSLPALDPALPFGEAYGINSAGDAVGASGSAAVPLAVLWRGRTVEQLGLLDPAVPFSEAYAINDERRIVGASGTPGGYAAVMWTELNGVVRLGALPQAEEEFGVALAISNSNQVTGVTSSKTGRHAFLWENGKMVDLGDLPGGGDASIGYGVNDRGWVTGSSQVKPGTGLSQSATEAALLHHAFLWTADTGMVDLNSLIDPADPLKSEVELLEAAVVTNDGMITGRALVHGSIRAYVLLPQPSKLSGAPGDGNTVSTPHGCQPAAPKRPRAGRLSIEPRKEP